MALTCTKLVPKHALGIVFNCFGWSQNRFFLLPWWPKPVCRSLNMLPLPLILLPWGRQGPDLFEQVDNFSQVQIAGKHRREAVAHHYLNHGPCWHRHRDHDLDTTISEGPAWPDSMVLDNCIGSREAANFCLSSSWYILCSSAYWVASPGLPPNNLCQLQCLEWNCLSVAEINNSSDMAASNLDNSVLWKLKSDDNLVPNTILQNLERVFTILHQYMTLVG